MTGDEGMLPKEDAPAQVQNRRVGRAAGARPQPHHSGAAAAGNTDTRPAAETAAPTLSREEVADLTSDENFLDNPDLLTRRTLGDTATDSFVIPDHLKKPGWDYEFKTRRVLGEPVSPTQVALERGQGWRPVPARDMAELLPPDYDKSVVELNGMIMVMRPKRLSREAHREMYEKAERQKQDKLKQALTGPADQDSRMPFGAIPGVKNTIEGHVGTWRPSE